MQDKHIDPDPELEEEEPLTEEEEFFGKIINLSDLEGIVLRDKPLSYIYGKKGSFKPKEEKTK